LRSFKNKYSLSKNKKRSFTGEISSDEGRSPVFFQTKSAYTYRDSMALAGWGGGAQQQ
jgi:hypothetical protein